VTTSSQLILAANEQRKFAEFVNDSDQDIYITFESPAVASTGIRISSDGFAYEIDLDALWLGDIFAIHAGTGNKKILIREWT
jgi:hypothetical protein